MGVALLFSIANPLLSKKFPSQPLRFLEIYRAKLSNYSCIRASLAAAEETGLRLRTMGCLVQIGLKVSLFGGVCAIASGIR
jgi:hypothetical protein